MKISKLIVVLIAILFLCGCGIWFMAGRGVEYSRIYVYKLADQRSDILQILNPSRDFKDVTIFDSFEGECFCRVTSQTKMVSINFDHSSRTNLGEGNQEVGFCQTTCLKKSIHTKMSFGANRYTSEIYLEINSNE